MRPIDLQPYTSVLLYQLILCVQRGMRGRGGKRGVREERRGGEKREGCEKERGVRRGEGCEEDGRGV